MVHLAADRNGSADRSGTRSSGWRSPTVRTGPPCGRARIEEITPGLQGCTLSGRSGNGDEIEVIVDVVPDRRLAFHWAASFRRLSWVELCRRGDTWQCTLHGTGFRLPIARRAPVAVGLGLAIAGMPLLLCDEAT
jgi:hypothetical protein